MRARTARGIDRRSKPSWLAKARTSEKGPARETCAEPAVAPEARAAALCFHRAPMNGFVGRRESVVILSCRTETFVQQPTLVVSGDRDGFAAPNIVEARAQDIASARFVVYHGAGHGLHREEPARFATDLAAFTGSLKNGSMPPGPAA